MFSMMECCKVFFCICLWCSKTKSSFSKNVIFCILFLIEEEKKFILFQHYFLYVADDGAREKTHSLKTLFFACCLWWSKRKTSFCYNFIFYLLSLMKQEKKLIQLKHYFLYVLNDQPIEKAHSVITLYFVCCVWWSKRKN